MSTVHSTAPVVAEHRRIERLVSGLRAGESTVINGTPVTAISLATADLLERHASVDFHFRQMSAIAATEGDFDRLLAVQDELLMCRCQLDAAGMLHLVEVTA